MDALPKTQTAIVGLEDGTLAILNNVRLPKLEDDMILVKSVMVGLNPVDTKMVGRLVIPGAIVGTDFAGYVVAIGSNAQCPGVKIGDRVAGVVQSSNPLQPDVGGFTEYIGATGRSTSLAVFLCSGEVSAHQTCSDTKFSNRRPWLIKIRLCDDEDTRCNVFRGRGGDWQRNWNNGNGVVPLPQCSWISNRACTQAEVCSRIRW